MKSAADGYTLHAASSGPISIMPNLQKIPYDPLKDLAPISLICATPFALVTHPSFPAANAAEFVALVKANPGKYTFTSVSARASLRLCVRATSLGQLDEVHGNLAGAAGTGNHVRTARGTYKRSVRLQRQTHGGDDVPQALAVHVNYVRRLIERCGRQV